MTEQTNAEIAIHLEDVWVQYQLRHAHHYNLKRALSNAVTRRRDDVEIINALRGITMTVNKGSRLGLVGPNGSGKSTLLAVMAGALTPTRGQTRTNGRVFALLGGPDEGLDPEQSGRENALMLGVRLGEAASVMDERLDQIHEFSGLGRRFDHPVYTYSSGMQVRLRFSTITSVKADILLVDEGIGAADAEFNERAATRLNDFYAHSGTLIVSSHAEEVLVSHCTEVLRLRSGAIETSAQRQ